jgi:hypothetical protein
MRANESSLVKLDKRVVIRYRQPKWWQTPNL